MSSNTTKSYVCVFCGTPCAALYRKLTSTSTSTSTTTTTTSRSTTSTSSTTISSIKAMNCDICQRIVDPYTEREWLLVAIDCILLRPEAYRHVLYNNQYLSLSWSSSCNKNNDNNDNNNHTTTTVTKTIVHRVVQWTIISSLLHAYLKWVTFVQEEEEQQQDATDNDITAFPTKDSSSSSTSTSSLFPLYTIFVITSILDLLVQWIAIYGFMKLVSILSSKSKSQSQSQSHNNTTSSNSINSTNNNMTRRWRWRRRRVAYQIFLALLLPTSFQIVTISVLIWENSNTTRSFGSILVACWQCLARDNGEKLNNNENTTILPIPPMTVLFPPLVGIVSLMVWRFGVSYLLRTITSNSNGNGNSNGGDRRFWWSNVTIPCVGFEFDVQQVVHNIYHYLLHYYYYVDTTTTVMSVVSPSSSPPPPSMMLCLT
ncbi:hypothetical protein FRACYDRAFT_232898 [Fragilariopsis cylindrus CCMP1102]|uniref:Protein ARV n=1 Tax=Fragilariopsis cylindrus CCMP1102 TaxID=635003 RepID=A0A1E7FX73_9STRA|nr:hypothetical protein FRACYDRAFT_232898 [Fragilariopsis cylindrus CCMP1102]|eukprot:OEU22739.1 hypothetical protein FRACYDRAFT_232898 [Fragilariopsis cylindrus CCMP1102]